jgi:hypothetical protein
MRPMHIKRLAQKQHKQREKAVGDVYAHALDRMSKSPYFKQAPDGMDSQRLARFHRSGRNAVDDLTRSNKPGSVDRAGNRRDTFSGDVAAYNRKDTHQGYTDDDANKAYDLGRRGKRGIGLRDSSVPVVTTRSK